MYNGAIRTMPVYSAGPGEAATHDGLANFTEIC
jgi:hypothetical protein